MTTLWYLPDHESAKNPYGQLFIRSMRARGLLVVPMVYDPLFGMRALSGRPDVIHFQYVHPYILPGESLESWWRAVLKGTLFLAQVALLRVVGCRIVWTVHNLVNHERRLAQLEWFFTLLFTRFAHLIVVHGAAARREVITRYRLHRRENTVAVLFHPNYIDSYPNLLTRDQARKELGVADETRIILCLGQIRAYKGLPELVSAFRALRPRTHAVLWIAGEPIDAELSTELKREADASHDIMLRAAFVPPSDVELLFKACDIVALPYRAILTSGAAALAMSFGKPCVAPRIGGLGDLLDEKGAFLYDPSHPNGLRDALERALESSDRWAAMGEHNLSGARERSWPKAAEILDGLYESLHGTMSQLASRSGGT